jgi:uncharacterized protein (DUF362 family)
VGTIYLHRGNDREAFVRKVFQRLDVQARVAGKHVLLKPNIVSSEPYPTTTHPATVAACLALLQGFAASVTVGDGPAWDAGDPGYVVEEHPLKESCDRFRVPLVDLLAGSARKVRTRTCELEVSQLALDCDLIISLPVLKSHGICGMTGALKNVLGLLSPADKRRLHSRLDVDRVIAELNEVVRPTLHIVDAVQTLTNTNEIRHGGKAAALGYMLAGTDPVSLDTLGLELLARVDPRLKRRGKDGAPHLKHAADLGVGEPEYEVVEL